MGLFENQSPAKVGPEIVDFWARDGQNSLPNHSKQVRRFAPHLFEVVWERIPAVTGTNIDDFRPDPGRISIFKQSHSKTYHTFACVKPEFVVARLGPSTICFSFAKSRLCNHSNGQKTRQKTRLAKARSPSAPSPVSFAQHAF